MQGNYFIVLISVIVSFFLNLIYYSLINFNDSSLQELISNDPSIKKYTSPLIHNIDNVKLIKNLITFLCFGFFCLSISYYFYTLQLLIQIIVYFILTILFFSVSFYFPYKLSAFTYEKTAFLFPHLLYFIFLIFSPVSYLIKTLSKIFIRLSGFNPNNEPSIVTEEEIRMLVDEGEEKGTIDTDEKKMINNIFEFDNRDVSEVMTHRTEVNAVPITASLSEAVDVAMESGNTRLPVFEDDIDHIVGILNVKDLLQYLQKPVKFNLRKIIRSPLFVPETGNCSDIFELMQKERAQIAVVVDEYGGTFGIVTMEDLLETIVGNIQDEYDNDQNLYIQRNDGSYLLDASIGITDIESYFDIHFPDTTEADTLGGYITEQTGFVPGDKIIPVTVQDIQFSIEKYDDKRILFVVAQRIEIKNEQTNLESLQ